MMDSINCLHAVVENSVPCSLTPSEIEKASISRNQILKLKGNPFQELVQNCGMRYQLS